MKTTKNLALVALAALSLGMGTAMAQEGGHDDNAAYWTLARQADAMRQMEARNASKVQAGSPDVAKAKTGVSHVLPFGNFANPG
jgi:hypothetical protein